ncbi:MAG: hypothetical protein Q9160_005086 [Pyrenula sp. 1 TL-2023]
MSNPVRQNPSSATQQSHKTLSSSVIAGFSPQWTGAIGFPFQESEQTYSDFDLTPNQEETYKELSEIAQSEKSSSEASDDLTQSSLFPPTEKDCLPFLIHSALIADEPLFGLLFDAYPSLLSPANRYYAKPPRMRHIILMAAILGSSVGIWRRMLDRDADCMLAQWGDEWYPKVLELVAEQGSPELMEYLLEREPAKEAVLDSSRACAMYREWGKQEMLDVIKKYWRFGPLPDEKFKA